MLSGHPVLTALRRIGIGLGLSLLLAATGCVERRMVILTECPGGCPGGKDLGAIVYDERDQPIGAAPVDKPFTYYGKYRFRLAKDGYETLVVEQPVRAPWNELPGLDFISENLLPWTIRDVRYFRYVLQPAQVRSPEQILDEAEMLRSFGKTVGEPSPFTPGPESAPTVLLPPTGARN
jgi:hypothetical protein